MTITFSGSNDVLNEAAGISFDLSGSSDTIYMAGGGFVDVLAGAQDAIYMTGGTLDTGSSVTGLVMIGSNDTVNAGAVNNVNIDGSNDVIAIGSSGFVGLDYGTGDTVEMSGGVLATLNDITNVLLVGSNDTVDGGALNNVNIDGSNDVISVGSSSVVGIDVGTGDTVEMNGGTLATLNDITNVLLVGSNDTVNAGASNDVNIDGSNDVLAIGSSGTVGIDAGTGDTVKMNGGTLATLTDVSGIILDGSNDIVGLASGDSIVLNGNTDIIDATEGSTVTLVAGDSGDTINMFGGTIVIGSTVLSNITVNGTGDEIVGGTTVIGTSYEVLNGQTLTVTGVAFPEAGPVTLAVSNTTSVGQYGTVSVSTPGYTPPVVYNAGDIQDLVNYFEANPNLSQTQIVADERDSDYQNNLSSWLMDGANVYGSSSSLPSNVMAMLDGYSSLYTAIMGVPTEVFSEAAYIEQQFASDEQNGGFPTDTLATILQNLMPTLLNPNPLVQNMVTLALGQLEASQNWESTNQDGINAVGIAIGAEFAKLAFEAAESDTRTSGGSLQTEYEKTNITQKPDKYEFWVTPDGTPNGTGSSTYESGDVFYIKNDTGTVLDNALGIIDTYLAPVIDVAAALSGNPEFLVLSSWAPELQGAALALNLVQTGQDFAAGDDVFGVLGVLGAIGGGLTQAAGSVGSEAAKFGHYLSEAVATAQGIDGVVIGAEEGQILTAIASGLGGLASLSPDSSDLHIFSAVGSGLASAGVAVSGGNILAALAALTTAASDPGVAHTLGQDLNALWNGFLGTTVGTTAYLQYAANTNVASDGTSGGPNPVSASAVSPTSSTPGIVTYVYSDGSEMTFIGGTLAWRNNNPGNMAYNSFTQSEGAIGSDEGFAVFPNVQIGESALSDLLSGSAYSSLTVDAAIAKYAPSSQNNTADYQAYIEGPDVLNLPGSTLLSQLTAEQMFQMIAGIGTKKGYQIGTIAHLANNP